MQHTFKQITKVGLLAGILCFGAGENAQAQTAGLFEWAVNIDGNVYNVTLGDSLPGSVNTSGFDDVTGLGTIVASITGVGPHYFALFVDHEIDEAINTFFNEYGEPVNTPAAIQSWEIDEPGYVFGDIYSNFEASSLDNINAVPAATPDDVSMALGWDFTLGAGQKGTITMNISDTPPGGEFYLAQTDPDSDYTIYFSSRLKTFTPGPNGVPDGGSSLAALAITLAGLAAFRRKL